MTLSASEKPSLPIRIYRGEHAVHVLTVTDPDTGAAVDLTGATLTFKVKRTVKETEFITALSKESGGKITHRAQTGDTLGQAEIEFEPDETATQAIPQLVHQIWITDAVGDPQPLCRPSPLIIEAPVGP